MSDNSRVIRIEGDGTSRNTKIFLGGVDVSRFVRELQLNIAVDKTSSVTLKCQSYVELPDELEALVTVEKAIEHAPKLPSEADREQLDSLLSSVGVETWEYRLPDDDE